MKAAVAVALSLASLTSLSALAAGGGAAADEFITAAQGKIAISTDDLPTEASDLGRLLKPAAKKTDPYRVEGDKSWSFNLVAVLKHEAKGASVHVVFYDKDDKEALKKFAPVRAIEVNPAAHNKLLTVPSIQVAEDQGFAAGKTYIVRVT
ncbi:MAG TPA: hypothetical protein VGO62_13025, partial [Myxococcota bacterium]